MPPSVSGASRIYAYLPGLPREPVELYAYLSLSSFEMAIGRPVIAFGAVAIIVVATIGMITVAINSGSTSMQSSPVVVYEELCSMIYGPPPVYHYLGSECLAPSPANTSTRFDTVSIVISEYGNTTVLQEAYFAVSLTSGQAIAVSINSSIPATFSVYYDNQASFNASTLVNETAHQAREAFEGGGETTDYGCVVASQNEWYIFVLSVDQLRPAATASFDIQPILASQVSPANGCMFVARY